MDLISRVEAKLAKYPEVRYTATPSSIRIEALDGSGFEVSLEVRPGVFVVHFDGWHEEFTSADDALNCLAFGLSDSCRLAVTYRGAMPTKWVLESRQGENWSPNSETGLLIFPFWRRSRVVYKRNHVLRTT